MPAPRFPSRTRWLRAAVPELRTLLHLPSTQRIRIALYACDDEADGWCIPAPHYYLILINYKLRNILALSALAHEMFHVTYGHGHTGKFARAIRKAGFSSAVHNAPLPSLRRKLQRVSRNLGPYPSN